MQLIAHVSVSALFSSCVLICHVLQCPLTTLGFFGLDRNLHLYTWPVVRRHVRPFQMSRTVFSFTPYLLATKHATFGFGEHWKSGNLSLKISTTCISVKTARDLCLSIWFVILHDFRNTKKKGFKLKSSNQPPTLWHVALFVCDTAIFRMGPVGCSETGQHNRSV